MPDETFYSIELDCDPMSPRPDTYIESVLAETGLTIDDFSVPRKWFGNWEWLLKNDEKIQLYIDAKPILKERIEALYHAGKIRYGSW